MAGHAQSLAVVAR